MNILYNKSKHRHSLLDNTVDKVDSVFINTMKQCDNEDNFSKFSSFDFKQVFFIVQVYK